MKDTSVGPMYFAQKGLVLDKTLRKILLIRYTSSRHNPRVLNKLALPGGKVEYGQTPDESCADEIQEETGVRVSPGFPVIVYSFGYMRKGEHVQINATARLCRYISGRPLAEKIEKETHIGDVRWHELSSLDWSKIVEGEVPAIRFVLDHPEVVRLLIKTPYPPQKAIR